MGIKAQELIDGCFAKASLDEPLFVLRGTDSLAPGIVRDWAERYRLKKLAQGVTGHELARAISKHTDALALAKAMDEFYFARNIA